MTCVTPPDKSKIRNGGDIMLACSPRSHEVTLRASAYALSRASRRRRTAFYNKAVLRRTASRLARLTFNGIQAKARFCLGMPQFARAEPRAVAFPSRKTVHWTVFLGRVLSNTPLKRLAHVPYREPFSDNLYIHKVIVWRVGHYR